MLKFIRTVDNRANNASQTTPVRLVEVIYGKAINRNVERTKIDIIWEC